MEETAGASGTTDLEKESQGNNYKPVKNEQCSINDMGPVVVLSHTNNKGQTSLVSAFIKFTFWNE